MPDLGQKKLRGGALRLTAKAVLYCQYNTLDEAFLAAFSESDRNPPCAKSVLSLQVICGSTPLASGPGLRVLPAFTKARRRIGCEGGEGRVYDQSHILIVGTTVGRQACKLGSRN